MKRVLMYLLFLAMTAPLGYVQYNYLLIEMQPRGNFNHWLLAYTAAIIATSTTLFIWAMVTIIGFFSQKRQKKVVEKVAPQQEIKEAA